MEKIERIPINIWDDYYEDGYVPEGKIQETYIYVEDSNISLLDQRESLSKLFLYMNDNLDLKGVEMTMRFFDSKMRYPNLKGEEYESMHYQRWKIEIENLTHKRREKLMDELNAANLSYKDIPFDIYSES